MQFSCATGCIPPGGPSFSLTGPPPATPCPLVNATLTCNLTLQPFSPTPYNLTLSFVPATTTVGGYPYQPVLAALDFNATPRGTPVSLPNPNTHPSSLLALPAFRQKSV